MRVDTKCVRKLTEEPDFNQAKQQLATIHPRWCLPEKEKGQWLEMSQEAIKDSPKREGAATLTFVVEACYEIVAVI